MSQESDRARRAYGEAWLRAIRTIVSGNRTADPTVEPFDRSVVESEPVDGICWLQLDVSGSASGHQALAIPRSSVKDFARLVGPVDDQSGSESVIDDPLAVLADRSAPLVAEVATGELKFSATETVAPEWTPAVTFSWRIETGSTEPITVSLCVDEALLSALEQAIIGDVSDPGPTSDITVGMLRDVRLPTTMRLGEAEIPLSDVLAFGAGNSQAVEPPYGREGELAVGGQVMARGEIVLVDGNYGLRITELVGEGARVAMLTDGELVG